MCGTIAYSFKTSKLFRREEGSDFDRLTKIA